MNATTFANRVLGAAPRRRRAVVEEFVADIRRDPCELADKLSHRHRSRRRSLQEDAAPVHGRRRVLLEEVRLRAGRVDRENSVIKNVCILGNPTSRNRNRYPVHALQGALRLYESAPSFVNHPEDPHGKRRLEARLGKIVNPRVVGNRLYADYEYNPRHPLAETLEWSAENDPSYCKLSHNVETRGHEDPDGTWVVDEILDVRSVDVVSEGGTTKSLFEAWEGAELPVVPCHHVRAAVEAPDIDDRERVARVRQILDAAGAGYPTRGQRDARDEAELRRFVAAVRHGTRETR